MAQSRVEGDWYVSGAFGCKTFVPPAASIGDSAIAPLAGIDATKLEHQHRIGYAQPNSTATAETRVVYVCYGATATILAFKAGSIVANVGGATVTVDLKKNGTTCLSAAITLDNANAAFVVEAGTLSVTSLVAGDVLEVVTTATIGGGTLATGVFATLTVVEDAQ